MSVIRVVKKFALLLNKHQRIRIFELGIIMVIGGLVEMCSISLVIPFMDAVMKPDTVMDKRYVSAICDTFNISSARGFLFLSAIILAMIYIVKNIYLLFEINIQCRFVYNNMYAMQRKLLYSFTHREYEEYLSINSSELIRIIDKDTPNTFWILTTVLNLFTEIIVSIILILTVFFIAPLAMACMAAVLLSVLLIINAAIKPKLRRAGLSIQKNSAGMNKWLLQSIEGIKEVKVTGKESFFQYKFDKYGYEYVQAERIQYILNITPRFLIEAVSMSSVFFVVAGLIYAGNEVEAVLPVLTAVAMAAVRILPSANRISSALATISYGEPMLDKLVESLKIVEIDKDDLFLNRSEKKDNDFLDLISGIEKSIEIKNISFCYKNAADYVIEDVSFSIDKGESIGIIGGSGAGKTTMVDIILGLLKPQSGTICVDGIDINDDISGWHRQIGYIPQFMFLLDGSIKENICFGIDESKISDEQLKKVIKEASLEEFIKSLPHGVDTIIGEHGARLSGGQKQRICIARALYRNPSVLVFDEATSALDNETEAAIMESINKLQGIKTLIIIAHRLTTIELCDHVYKVNNKKIDMVR